MGKISKKILIVGGCGGVGRRLARLYVLEGHKVAVTGVRFSEFVNAFDTPQGVIKYFDLDITNEEETFSVFKEFSSDEKIDLVINCAAISDVFPQGREVDIPTVKNVLSVNLFGALHVLDASQRFVKEKGQIVAISSVASFRGLPEVPGYSASKCGLNNLMESFAVRTKNGKTFTNICLGFVKTGLLEAFDPTSRDLKIAMDPDRMARKIKKAISKKRAFVIIPGWLVLIKWVLALMPFSVFKFLWGLRFEGFLQRNMKNDDAGVS